MTNALESHPKNVRKLTTCDNCRRSSDRGWSFAFKKPVTEGPGMTNKCSWCAVRHRPMLLRSLIVALIVGTILTVLNQGDILFAGSWQDPLYWKIPVTYFVPFCVVTYGALSNGRS